MVLAHGMNTESPVFRTTAVFGFAATRPRPWRLDSRAVAKPLAMALPPRSLPSEPSSQTKSMALFAALAAATAMAVWSAWLVGGIQRN